MYYYKHTCYRIGLEVNAFLGVTRKILQEGMRFKYLMVPCTQRKTVQVGRHQEAHRFDLLKRNQKVFRTNHWYALRFINLANQQVLKR